MRARKILSLLAASAVALVNCQDNHPLAPAGPTIKGEALRDVGAGTLSVTDGRIVYGTGTGISIMNADGTNAVQILAKSFVRDPSWSPDGQKIAFSGQNGIYVVNQDGTGLEQVTSTDATGNCHRRPRWSPDGSKIVFYRHSACTTPRPIMIVDLATKVVTSITSPGAGFHAYPDWSHDGTRIAFSDPSRSPTIYTVNADGSNLTGISSVGGFPRASWSPNDSLIAYNATDGTGIKLWLMKADGSNVTQLPTVASSGPFASWSPDGTRILYQAQTGADIGALRIVQADGSADAALTGSVTITGYDWGAASPPPPPPNTAPTAPTVDCTPTSTPTGQSITCTASGSTDVDGDAITYVWSSTDRTGGAQGTSTTYSRTLPGTTAVTAYATDGTDNSNNSNEVTLTFTNRSPTAPTVLCDTLTATTGETITCSASGSTDPDGGTITYNWSATDRTGSATGTSTSYSRSTAGGTSVTAYSTDGQGGQSDNSNTVALTFNNPPPPPNTAPTAPTVDCIPTSTPTGQSITCTASGSTDVDGDAVTYVWSATDRTGGAQGTSTTYSRALPGTTAVTAHATDGIDDSNNSNEVTLTFTNRSPTTPNVSCDPLTATIGETITCSASGSTDPDGGTITYNWSATDRTGSSTGSSTTYSRSTAGGTSVTAYASDGQGGQSSNASTVSLTFNNPPPPPPIATTTVVSADPASPSSYVASVTFTAHVTRTSNGADVTTGNIEFRSGGTDCSSGTVAQSAGAVDGTGRKTFTTRTLQSRYAIRACYLGDSPYVASNGSIVWPPDTDGDGIVDGIDEQPLVPSTRFNRNNVTVGRIVSAPSFISYYAVPGGWTNGVRWEFTLAPGATGTYADVIVIQLDGKATRYEMHPFVNSFGNIDSCFAGKPCVIQISDPTSSLALEVLDGQGTMVVVVNGETVVITVANGATGTVTEYKNSSGAVTEIAVEATGTQGGVTVNGYPIPAGTTTAFGRLQATTKISSGKAPSLNLSGSFTPASSSNGMNPVTEQVVFRVGPYTWTIPAGSFRLNPDGAYTYSGVLNGVTVSAQIKQPGKKGSPWTFQLTAGPITTFALPAPIFLRIGNDAGSTKG